MPPPKLNTETFIIEAKKIHGDKYDYSKSIYTLSKNTIIIICPTHGEFHQSSNTHIGKGCGCKKCSDIAKGMKMLMTQEEFIKRCEEKHPNLLDYSKTVYINTKTPITFICNTCKTEFNRDPNHMLGKGRGHGCITCKGGVKDTYENFIKKANSTHNNAYKYDLVKYINSITKIQIICEDKHIFEQTPSHHIDGNGCPYCSGRGKTIEDFIKLSTEKFPNMFDYSQAIFVNMKTPITLICKEKHTFATTPSIHFRDNSLGGCRLCADKVIAKNHTYTQEQWIQYAKERHNNIYNYDKVIYKSSNDQVIITCNKHGDFEQLPVSHLGGYGCSKCGIEYRSLLKTLTDDELNKRIEIAKIVHNHKYTYNRVFRNTGEIFIEAVCPLHNIFSQRLYAHLSGRGCRYCVIQHSKAQLEWLEYRELGGDRIQHAGNIGEYRIPDTRYSADGFRNNTIFEFHGDFWHGNPRVFNPNSINPITGTTYQILFDRTQQRTTYLIEMGYTIVAVWELDWNNGKKAVKRLQQQWRLLHKN